MAGEFTMLFIVDMLDIKGNTDFCTAVTVSVQIVRDVQVPAGLSG